MDWKDLAPVVGASAPLLGKLVSIGVSFIPGIGPIAGPIIGPAVGSIIAAKFGVPATPAAVAEAIRSDPDAAAKLQAATEQIKAQYAWAAAVETGQLRLEEVQLQQVGETARAELLVESPFKTWWRPFNGWVVGVENACFGACAVGCLVLALLGNSEPLLAMSSAWPLLLSVLGPPCAIVGVNVIARSAEKTRAMEVTRTAPPPGKPAPPPPLPPARVATPAPKKPLGHPIVDTDKLFSKIVEPLPGRSE